MKDFCAIDLVSKYACVVPLKYKEDITIINAFQSILDNSKRKPIYGLIKVVNSITGLLKKN